jgi:hypothetical protein
MSASLSYGSQTVLQSIKFKGQRLFERTKRLIIGKLTVNLAHEFNENSLLLLLLEFLVLTVS